VCDALIMDQEDLFKSYINICNQALDKNKDRFPFNRLFHGVESANNIMPARVKIVDDTGQPEFHLQLNNGEVQYDIKQCQNECLSCHSRCGGGQSDVWTVRTSYLKDVVKNPTEYIENPAKLDWEWVGFNN